MSRYEILKREPTPLQEQYGVARPVFVVWDHDQGRQVPFGSYRTRKQAEDRVARMEAREAEAL